MPRCGFSAEMASPEPSINVSVVDVYELAADIGKECEVSIEKFGSEAVSSLLPKVINALELLEALAARSDRDERTRRELAAQVTRLENDKVERAEHRQRFEKVRIRGRCYDMLAQMHCAVHLVFVKVILYVAYTNRSILIFVCVYVPDTIRNCCLVVNDTSLFPIPRSIYKKFRLTHVSCGKIK